MLGRISTLGDNSPPNHAEGRGRNAWLSYNPDLAWDWVDRIRAYTIHDIRLEIDQ